MIHLVNESFLTFHPLIIQKIWTFIPQCKVLGLALYLKKTNTQAAFFYTTFTLLLSRHVSPNFLRHLLGWQRKRTSPRVPWTPCPVAGILPRIPWASCPTAGDFTTCTVGALPSGRVLYHASRGHLVQWQDSLPYVPQAPCLVAEYFTTRPAGILSSGRRLHQASRDT